MRAKKKRKKKKEREKRDTSRETPKSVMYCVHVLKKVESWTAISYVENHVFGIFLSRKVEDCTAIGNIFFTKKADSLKS